MKRKLLISFIAILGFVCGWICACIILQQQFAERQARSLEQARKELGDKAKNLRQQIFGSNNFHQEEISPIVKAQLAGFAPSKSIEYITLAYIGGLGGSDFHLTLYGDGTIYSEDHGRRQLISTIPPDRCNSFFHRVLTSGILNYSEDIVALKEELLAPDRSIGVTDRANTEIRISVPKLKVEQAISVYAPDVELKNFPDIIEFQTITQIEHEILDLVPKGYPLWK